MFPIHRPRRLRENPTLRKLVRETSLEPGNLVYPLFICEGKSIRKEIKSMPGVFHLSIDQLSQEAKNLQKLGIPAVILFGVSSKKDAMGTEAYAENGLISRAIAALKKAVPDLLVMADVCLCEYTDHGHCGVVRPPVAPSFVRKGEAQFVIENDTTLELLSRMSGILARAGADVIAPSDMMDGRIQAIRDELDAVGYKELPILSYAAKYASAFYGPFREAAQSKPAFGDRSSYQMDPANLREAITEAHLDIEEGADILMVKPALPCLDVLHSLREQFTVPLAAYQVSGEYAMIKAGAKAGYLDEKRVVLESLLAIKRAGAGFILTYFAKDAARYLKEQL